MNFKVDEASKCISKTRLVAINFAFQISVRHVLIRTALNHD